MPGPRVLVPRGGAWGEAVAELLRARGADPLIAPLVGFAPPADPAPLADALNELAVGAYDWLAVTSATTVGVLLEHGATVPAGTRIAAVGESTAAALAAAGLPVHYVPVDHSWASLAAQWPAESGRVLLPQSDLADPGLVRELAARGLVVRSVTAYRNVAIPVADSHREQLAAGKIAAILVTSESIAAQVAIQLGPLPARTAVACIGPRTAAAAASAGLGADLIAPERSIESLIDCLLRALRHASPEAWHPQAHQEVSSR